MSDATASTTTPGTAIMAGKERRMMCIGMSMFPTLKPGDELYWVPVPVGRLHKGDVIIFESHENRCNVVHRITALQGHRIVTRGDNNSQADEAFISLHEIKGRVTRIRRRGEDLALSGFFRGHIIACLLAAKRRVSYLVRKVLRPLYCYILGTGHIAVACHYLRFPLNAQIVKLQRSEGIQHLLVLRNKKIGWYDRSQKSWIIIAPYALAFDPSKLHHPE